MDVTDCGAVYQGGRWQWSVAPAGARQELWPACHRVRDHFPAGYVKLSGDFLAANCDELLQLARHREARERPNIRSSASSISKMRTTAC